MDSTVILTIFKMTLVTVYVNAASTRLRGSDKVAFKDSSFTLICDVTSGNIASVAFLNQNNIIASVSYINGECRDQDTGKLCSLNVCSCNGTRTYNWTLASVPETWHNTALNCDSVHGGAVSNIYNLYVSVAVTAANISPAVVKLDVVAGRLTQFACISHPASRPNATITWFLESKDGNTNRIAEGITTQIVSAGDRNLTVTNSSLFYNPNKNENGFYLYCSAKSEHSMAITSDKILLNVLFNPDTKPTLVTNPPMDYFVLNSTLEIICEILGGNPLTNLTWTCDNADLDEHVLDVSTKISSIMKLVIFINSSEIDGERCICTATHFINSFMKSKEFVIKLEVPDIKSTFSQRLSTTVNYEKQTVSDDGSESGESTGSLVAGVIGGVCSFVIVIGIIVAIACFIILRQRKRGIPGKQKDNEENSNGCSVYDYIKNDKDIEITDNESNVELENGKDYLTASASDIALGEIKDEMLSAENKNDGAKVEQPLTSREYEKLRDSRKQHAQQFTDKGNTNEMITDEGEDKQKDRQENVEIIEDTTSGYLEPTPKQSLSTQM